MVNREYIERETAIVRATRVIKDAGVAHDVKEALKALPVENVRAIIHGYWIANGEMDENGNAHYNCSVCGAGEDYSESVTVSYCWNCGARMDAEDFSQYMNPPE